MSGGEWPQRVTIVAPPKRLRIVVGRDSGGNPVIAVAKQRADGSYPPSDKPMATVEAARDIEL